MKKTITVVAVVLFTMLLLPYLGAWVADRFTPHFKDLDPGGEFVWSILRHGTVGLLIFLIMASWPSISMPDWGFRRGRYQMGVKWVSSFAAIWFFVYLAIYIYYVFNDTQPSTYYNVRDLRNFAGEFFFRAFVAGISEELFFRSFPIVMLLAVWKQKVKIFNYSIRRVTLLSAIIYAIAQIGVDFSTMEIYHFDPLQIPMAFGLGLLFAVTFERTRSILYPVLMHTFSDIIPVIILYFLNLTVG